MDDKLEKLGQAIDRIENLAFALKMELPAQVHVKILRKSLPDVAEELKEGFIEATGENPWE